MLPHFTHQEKESEAVKALFLCLVPVLLSETGEAAGFVSLEASQEAPSGTHIQL